MCSLEIHPNHFFCWDHFESDFLKKSEMNKKYRKHEGVKFANPSIQKWVFFGDGKYQALPHHWKFHAHLVQAKKETPKIKLPQLGSFSKREKKRRECE